MHHTVLTHSVEYSHTVGFGTLAGSAYYTLLNARQVPGYTAHVAAYQPIPGLIRRGFSQDTSNLSPFTFNSVWEGDVLADIYDTMLSLILTQVVGTPSSSIGEQPATVLASTPTSLDATLSTDALSESLHK